MEGNIDDLGGLILQSGNPLPLIFVLFDVFGGDFFFFSQFLLFFSYFFFLSLIFPFAFSF